MKSCLKFVISLILDIISGFTPLFSHALLEKRIQAKIFLKILPIDFCLYLCFSFYVTVVLCRTGFYFFPEAVREKRQ